MEECRELVKKINDGETYAEKLKQAAIDGALVGVMLSMKLVN